MSEQIRIYRGGPHVDLRASRIESPLLAQFPFPAPEFGAGRLSAEREADIERESDIERDGLTMRLHEEHPGEDGSGEYVVEAHTTWVRSAVGLSLAAWAEFPPSPRDTVIRWFSLHHPHWGCIGVFPMLHAPMRIPRGGVFHLGNGSIATSPFFEAPAGGMILSQ